MSTYARGGYRPFPRAVRARHQVERGRLPLCPRCGHAVIAHAIEEGRRVCTRGQGVIACRDCARPQARMSPAMRSVFDLAEAFRLAPRPELWQPLVLT